MNPNQIDLTTVDAVKLFGTVKGTNDDELIQSAITAFSQFVLNYCGRNSLSQPQSYTEILDGTGSERIFTRNTPILSVELILVNGIQVPQSLVYGQAGYFIEQEGRSIAIRVGGSSGFNQISTFSSFPGIFAPFIFSKGIGNIQIVYTSGFAIEVTNEPVVIAGGTVELAFGATWFADLGIKYSSTLVPLVLVQSAPNVGQYAVSDGTYVFNVGDEGAAILISYKYGATPPDLEFAVRQTVNINYQRKDYRDHASKSFTPNTGSSTTTFRDWAYPPEVARVLQSYRRFTF